MDSFLYFGVVSAIVLVLMAVSFFFSMSETALIALSKIKLRHMLAKGVKGAVTLQRLLNKMDKVIAAIQKPLSSSQYHWIIAVAKRMVKATAGWIIRLWKI